MYDEEEIRNLIKDEGNYNSFGEEVDLPEDLEGAVKFSPEQMEIFEARGKRDIPADEKLAKYIYEFLNEKSNQIPTPEFVSQVREKFREALTFGDSEDGYLPTRLISAGYGVDVTDRLKVNIRKMDSDVRFVITPEEYYKVGKDNKKEPILLEKDNEGGYDLGRVEALQDVLAKSNEIKKGKMM